MKRSTGVRIAGIIGLVWAATLVLMLVQGDPQARGLLREFAGLSVLAGAMVWATYRFRILPRRGSFEGQASDAGLHAEAGDPLGLLGSPFSLFRRPATARELENTAWGSWKGRDVVVADYWYVPGSNTARDDERRFMCVIDEAGRTGPTWLSYPPASSRSSGTRSRSGTRTWSTSGSTGRSMCGLLTGASPPRCSTRA
jgi:hypothetical protein